MRGAAQPLHWRVALAPESHAPRAARRALAGSTLIPPMLLPDLQLLASELITNSVVHGVLRPHDRIEVALTCADGRLRVEVTDPGPGFDPGVSGEGRGLKVVDGLAHRWGVRCERRTHVWFEYDLA